MKLLEIHLSALSSATQILGNSSSTQTPSGHRSGLGGRGRYRGHSAHLPSRDAAAGGTCEWDHPDAALDSAKEHTTQCYGLCGLQLTDRDGHSSRD